MFERGIFAAFAALLVSATLVGNADAYPTTARSGTTTVTGTYRPLNLNLSLKDGTDALTYGESGFSYSATYDGDYTGVGYDASGLTGDWQLSFNSNTATDNGSIITVRPDTQVDYVGRLTYLGGGNYTGVPHADTPQPNDYFLLYPNPSPSNDPFLYVTCLDGVGTCKFFSIELRQALQHLGPFSQILEFELDLNRLNRECLDKDDEPVPCGSVPAGDAFRASSTGVPEPASLALVGVAFAGLAVVRRRQHGLRRV